MLTVLQLERLLTKLRENNVIDDNTTIHLINEEDYLVSLNYSRIKIRGEDFSFANDGGLLSRNTGDGSRIIIDMYEGNRR